MAARKPPKKKPGAKPLTSAYQAHSEVLDVDPRTGKPWTKASADSFAGEGLTRAAGLVSRIKNLQVGPTRPAPGDMLKKPKGPKK